MRKFVLALLILVITASFAAADTIYLRDGRTIRGTVLGFIDGRFVVRVDLPPSVRATTGSTSDGGDIQYLDPRDIQRIEIEGRSLDEARFQTHTVNVTLGPNWTDTGVDVRRGQRVQVRASGIIDVGRRRIAPEGLRATDPSAPLPNAAEGELIASINNDPNAPVIELGRSRDFVADQDGRLFMTANRGDYTGARGSFTVRILTERGFTASGSSDNNAFGQPVGDMAPAASRRRGPREKSVTVPGESAGTDTGIDLRTGDQVTFTATGTIVAGRKVGSVGPEGGRARGIGSVLGELIGAYPIPEAGIGALGGYIQQVNGQTTQPFLIGSQKTLTAPADGRLYLMINDNDYSNHTGSFTVRIRY